MDLYSLKKIGQGGFSKVELVKDANTSKLYARKTIFPRYIKHVHKEIKILNIIKKIKHKNIVNYIGNQYSENKLGLIFERLELNLYDFYKQYPERIDYLLVCKFTKQILDGIEFIHSIFIIHADLKPENVMIKDLETTTIKIIDFGSSIVNGLDKHTHFYRVSRYYRAPELVYEEQFNEKIDIWSVGCILYELIVFKPLFVSRNAQTLKLIMTTLSYERGFLKYLQMNHLFKSFSNNEQLYIASLLYKLLEYNQENRYSATKCLSSPFFNKINI